MVFSKNQVLKLAINIFKMYFIIFELKMCFNSQGFAQLIECFITNFQFSFGYDITARTARRDSFFEFLSLFFDVLTALPLFQILCIQSVLQI